MAKINILPQSVYNRIAAGEVIEKPYSVVKELVENAIDAGATEIEVFVDGGGTESIRVVDNGCGIERTDLHAAFLPHATSKIEKVKDLENIVTLGFRGEAVASIASVSKMTITSKTENGKCYRLTSTGGELGEITEVSGRNGTEVAVENLFFNQPVRFKFLRTPRAEEGEITTFITRFILNRPDISFTYTLNGKRILQSYGGGFEEAMAEVYGASVLGQCFHINAEKNGIRLHGYIGNQNFYKANKSYQTVFLNGRFVQNVTIATAISTAYNNYLMKRQYPFYVLHVEVPTEVVDVNVHPNKSDVRFADNRIIYASIYTVINSVLEGNAKALEYVVAEDLHEKSEVENQEEKVRTEPKKSGIKPFVLSKEDIDGVASMKENADNKDNKVNGAQKQGDLKPKSLSSEILEMAKAAEEKEKASKEKKTSNTQKTFTYEQAKDEIKDDRFFLSSPYTAHRKIVVDEKALKRGFTPIDQIADFDPLDAVRPSRFGDLDITMGGTGSGEFGNSYQNTGYYREVMKMEDHLQAERDAARGIKPKSKPKQSDVFEENKRFIEELEAKQRNDHIIMAGCRYAGKIFNTYLLYERFNDLFIIDQHAAHERLIFDRLKEKMKNRKITRQPMLVPFLLSVNSFEAEFIRERLEDIREMGFDISEINETEFAVYAVPLELCDINLEIFFHDILGDVKGYRSIKIEELLKDKLASSACKAAIRGGMDLTEKEVETLFEMMDGNMGLKCPHGRPVVVKMTKTQFEKMFKRIV